jgi:exosortase
MSNHDSDRPLTPTFLALIALAGFGPLMAQFFYNLWQFDTYQFFPLALAGGAFLVARGVREARRPLKPGSLWLRIPLILAMVAMLASAAVMWSPWLGAASMLLAVVAASWWFGGWRLLREVLPGWLVLLTVLPPPLKLDSRFAMLLQEWATAGSSRLLGLLGIPHLLTGLIIEIPGQRLLVEEACSGINSVLFMTSACVFYAMWQRRSLIFLGLLYAFTIACVLAGNLVRITSGAWVLFNFQIDLFAGWKHEALGLVLTAFYLGFIVVADALLGKVFASKSLRRTTEVDEHPEPVLEGWSFGGGIRFVTVLLAILGAVQLVRGWDFHFRKENARRINPAWMDGSAKFTLPREIDGWRLVSDVKPVPKRAAFEDGVFSHIWQYQKGGTLATISFDYPFFGYHDVTVCYRNAGWKIGDTKLQRANSDNAMVPCMEVVLEREGGLKADLLYSTVDETGVWLEEPGKRSPYDEEGKALQEGNVASRLTHRMRQLPYANEAYDDAINYRIQILAAARGGLGTEQRAQVETLFRKSRVLIADQFIAPSATPTPTPKVIPTYEALPNSTPDATQRALEEAKKDEANRMESAPDATRKALQDARTNPTEEGTRPVDPTKKAVENAIKEAREAEAKQ